MGQYIDEFKRGATELLVLHLLSKEDMYGYQITHTLEEMTDGGYTLLEGTLYPILYKLEDSGCITSYGVKSGARRVRKYYHLEEPGIRRYKEMLKDYKFITDCIFGVLSEDKSHE